MRNETPQPGSDERDELARLLPAPPERDIPSDRQRRIQEFVVNHIQDQGKAAPPKHRMPRRRFAIVTGALAALVTAAVVLNIVAAGGGPTGGSSAESQSEAVKAFEMAASYAAAQPWTEPHPDQWFYFKYRDTRNGAMAETKGNDGEEIREGWYRADGTDAAWYDEAGTLVGPITAMNNSEYPRLVTLPTEPTALLAALRQQIVDHNNGIDADRPPFFSVPEDEVGWNATLFARISQLLSENLLPPALTAALFRAAAQIPGVSVADEPAVIDGRETTAIGMPGLDMDVSSQMLLDPVTHEYVGWREVALNDFNYGGPSASADPGDDEWGASITEKAGELLWENIRLVATVVDNRGDTS